MKGSTALKKIQTRAKALKKKHPKANYRNLLKQAGKEFKAGKLKKRKVSGVKKATPVKRKKRAAKKSPKVQIVTRVVKVGSVKRRTRRRAPKKITRRRRVGNSGKSMLPIILGVAALGTIAYLALRPATPAYTAAYQPTGNSVTDSKAGEIMAWASAAGVGITAISALINALNAGKTSQIYDSYKAGGNPLDSVAGFVTAPYSDN